MEALFHRVDDGSDSVLNGSQGLTLPGLRLRVGGVLQAQPHVHQVPQHRG